MNNRARPCDRHPVPQDRVGRTVLLAVRRMAVNGLRDANATWIMMDLFSARFRRPLVLLRAFVLELSHGSFGRPVKVAACCSPGMTDDEASILRILTIAALDVQAARDMLVELTDCENPAEPLSAAIAFSRSLIEDIRPERRPRPKLV